jgi:hypothetical protein
MKTVSEVLMQVSICIGKYKLNILQTQDFIHQVRTYEETSNPLMRLQVKSDDPIVEKAFLDYMNHQTGSRIGEYQS